MLVGLGAQPAEVRRPADLDALDGLIVPGGESTTLAKGLHDYGLEEPLKRRTGEGLAVFGTCAGLILLGSRHLDLVDIDVVRNAYGRQRQSFEADVIVTGLGDEVVNGVFIRAPRIERCGEGVEILAELDGAPVVVRQDHVLAATFHPELTDDTRMHAMFLAMVDGVVPLSGDRQPQEA
jgi:5'-phosphate synthase pdxT subunit